MQMFQLLQRGRFRAKPLCNATLLGRIRIQARFYARSRLPVRKTPVQKTERETWIDPFKRPDEPKPDYRTLIRPALFTVFVVVSGDVIADYLVDRRTSHTTKRAERQKDTA